MRTANLANEAVRHSEVGMVWEEKMSGTSGSIEVPAYATFRVRAAASTTVTVDGVLAMTMASGEIAIFNAGAGDPSDSKLTITIALSGNAYVQVARDINRKI